jgi:tRNA uridine 5-carbamoylmethylation protein Kti12
MTGGTPAARKLLIAFSGLPAVGKTVIAREVARQLGAVYLRIDSIEQRRQHLVIDSAPSKVEPSVAAILETVGKM